MPRRGFTLVELLVVIVVLAVLAGLVFGAWGFVERQKADLTRARLTSLGTQLEARSGLKGRPPAALPEMAQAMDNPGWMAEGKFLDGWDRPIEYRVEGKTFRLWSCGADGVSGTADDLEYKRK